MLCTCEPLNKQQMLGVHKHVSVHKYVSAHVCKIFYVTYLVTHLLFEAAKLIEWSKASTEPVNTNAL